MPKRTTTFKERVTLAGVILAGAIIMLVAAGLYSESADAAEKSNQHEVTKHEETASADAPDLAANAVSDRNPSGAGGLAVPEGTHCVLVGVEHHNAPIPADVAERGALNVPVTACKRLILGLAILVAVGELDEDWVYYKPEQ